MNFYLKMSACILTVAAYGLSLWQSPYTLFTFLVGMPVCIWLAGLLHELGHFITYKIFSFEWKRMVISCFVFERDKGLRVDKKQKLFSACCTCAYDAKKGFWQYVIALLSGGLCCLIVSVGAIVTANYLFGGLQVFFMHLGIACALNAVINLLLPFSADRRLLKQIKQERENTP